ncbi:MAG: NYN domain-containing protein [Azospirillum sp.]|nr:NYN domain-containing protein [Azospirillum sp.]
MRKVALLIDGGYLRALSRKAGHKYGPDLIEKVAHACAGENEEILRILYYDCPPHIGTTKLPVSGGSHTFQGSDAWLHDLARRDLFAVRLGVLKFRGWKPKEIPISGAPLTDANFQPDFEQKGVDMRIGLDIATLSSNRAVERIILITADTDFIPAMKHGRKSGLQLVVISLPGSQLTREFLEHADINRQVGWPA